MSFNPKNPIYSPEVSSDPSSPPTGTRGLYPKSDGWYDIDDNGKFKKILVDTDETLETDSKNIIGAINEVKNTKVDEIELERLKYYGDKDIVPSDESYFTVDESGTIIIGLSDTGITQTELVIPYVINGILITQIGDNCFLANKSITKVIIPNSVTSIGYEAFATCTSVKDVQVSNSVNSISSGLFKGCTLLSSVNIPEGVINIYSEAFLGCTSLSSINIPDSVTEIGTDAFSDCTSLSSINIPDSVKTIEIGAFGGCTSLVNVKVPNSTKYMVTSMFSGCTSLKNITIPDSVIDIEPNAFWSCTSLTKVNIPNGVTSIGSTAFENCPNLTIYCEQGSYAETYAKANNIPVIYTEVKAEVIDNKADKSTTLSGYGITDAYTKGEIDSKISNVYEIKGSSTVANLPTNPEVGDVYNITDSGTITGTEIVLSAGDNVVYTSDGWDKLAATVDLSSYATETELERLQYYGDKDIVPSDENYFAVNSTGETITGLTEEGKTQAELVIPYKINGKLITSLFSSEGTVSILYGNNVITKVVIPNSVTTIGTDAFHGCSSLTSINIPNSVTSIEDFAFQNCSSLTSINIPNGVTSIRYNAFYGCSSLTSVNIPNSVTSIEEGAFSDCFSLTSINIPNSVTSIGEGAFSYCTNLKIYCEQGSAAETYAKANNIPVVYTDINESFVKNARPYIENTIPTTEALSPNTIYDIGVQNDLTLILPTAEVGNFIQVDFLSGATATTLTVSASSSALLSDYDFTPEPNMIYSLFFDYGVLGYDETAHSNIYGWRFNYAEYTYTPDGSEG